MVSFVRRWLGAPPVAQLERRLRLAADMDHLLLQGTLNPDTRLALQRGRAQLEQQIRAGLIARSPRIP